MSLTGGRTIKDFDMSIKNAYFAGGCFWCITPIFKIQSGVLSVVSGFSGGEEEAPRYEDVKAQKTGHRETVCVEFDDSLIQYENLLDIFLAGVDPYDGEGQYIDRGRSYTLAVYYTDDAEKEIAHRKITSLESSSEKRVFISLEPFKSFYPADEYHQDFYLKNPEAFEKEMIESGRRETGKD